MIETYSAANESRLVRQWSRAVPQTRVQERRRWPRLPLAVPVFVRGADKWGKNILEFSTIVNISAGGVYFAIRRRPYSPVFLEIPIGFQGIEESAGAKRNFQARVLRVVDSDGWYWCAAKFKSAMKMAHAK